MPVTVARGARGRVTVPGESLDVSPFGLTALLTQGCDEDEVVEVTLALPAGPVTTGAVVIRSRSEPAGFRVSLAFYRLELPQFEVLRDFVDAARGG